MRQILERLGAPRARHGWGDEQGASAVEYGLLAALIAGFIVVAVMAFGGVVSGMFTDTETSFCSNPGPGSAQTAACASG